MPTAANPPLQNCPPGNRNPLSCPHCSDHRFVSYGTKRQNITDLPLNGTPTRIALDRSRYRCKSCGRTFLESFEDVEDGRSVTKRLTAYVETQAQQRSFVSVARETGLSEATVRNIFNAYLARIRNNLQFQTPDFLALEPITVINNGRYLVNNVRTRTIVDLLEADTPEAVADYLRRIPDRDAVEFVLMDARDDVRLKVWEQLPPAQTIVGRRHLISLVAKFCDEVRLWERGRCSSHQRRGLAQDKAIFNLRERDLSPSQLATLEQWREEHEEVLRAYLLKEGFYDLFDLTGKKVAKKAFKFWHMDMEITTHELERMDCFSSLPHIVIDTIWPGEFLRWFEYPSIRRYEQEVVPLLEALPKIGRKHSFEAVRAKVLSIEEGRTQKGIRFDSAVSALAAPSTPFCDYPTTENEG